MIRSRATDKGVAVLVFNPFFMIEGVACIDVSLSYNSGSECMWQVWTARGSGLLF